MFFNRTGSVEWVVVFLGNPGKRYERTRHNAGFMAADAFAKKHDVKIDRLKFRALTGVCGIDGKRVLLMKPQTFMNLSGEAAAEALSFYKVPTEKLIVVSDDVALDLGRIRVRRSGSAGGHNGLKNIIMLCGGEGFPRIRIGVGKPERELMDWVTSEIDGETEAAIRNAADRAADAVEYLIINGPDKTMNTFNSALQ